MVNQRRFGILLGYVNMLVKNIVNLLYVPMLLSFVDQSSYGVYQTSNNFIASLQLLSFGFSGAYVRFYMLKSAESGAEGVSKLNGMYLILYTCISTAAIVLGFLFSKFCGVLFSDSFSISELNLAQSIMVVLTLNSASILMSNVFDAFIVVHECFAFQQSRQMFAALATPFISFIMLSVGFNVVGVAVAQLLVNVILLILNGRYAICNLGMRFSFVDLEASLFKSLAVFSVWLFLGEIFNLISLNIPSVILAATLGSASVAVFSIGASIRSIFYSVSLTISNLFIPSVNRMVANRASNEDLTFIMIRIGRWQALILWWVFGGFVILGQWFISIWAGQEYSSAYWYLISMYIVASVPLVQNIGIEIQKAKNMHKIRSLIYLISAILDIIITYILSGYIGVWSAVVGYAIYIIFSCWLFMNWYYRYRVGINVLSFWRRILPVILGCVFPASVCRIAELFIPVDSILSFFLWGIVYTSLCCVVQWCLVFDEYEKNQFRKIFLKIERCLRHGISLQSN